MNRTDSRYPRGKVLVILAISLLAVTCHKKPLQPAPPAPALPQPAAPVPPPPVPVPTTWPELPLPPSTLPAPPEPPLPRDFRDGEAYFQSGQYSEAVRCYDRYIREDPIVQFRDVAMFKRGMAQTLACNSTECRIKSQDDFKRLISRFPQSPYSAEARFILSLMSELDRLKSDVKAREDKNQKLTEELERLKKIDLERQSGPIKK